MSLPRGIKRTLVIVLDVWLCFVAVWMSYYLRLGDFIALDRVFWVPALTSVVLTIPIFCWLGLYQSVFRFSGPAVVKSRVVAFLIYGFLFFLIFTVVGWNGVPRTIGIIQPIVLFLLVTSLRVFITAWLGAPDPLGSKKNVLIYGAGSGGRQLLRSLNFENRTNVQGFVDDDPQLLGQRVEMTPVYPSASLERLIIDKEIQQIFVAIPSLSTKKRKEILDCLSDKHVDVRILPTVGELANGRVTLDDAKKIDVEDLLGRASIDLDNDVLREKFHGKGVLITGAGGSIGSELCRQILRLNPSFILLYDFSEPALYRIHEELISPFSVGAESGSAQLIPILGSVVDMVRIRQVLSAWSIDIIYHAAAYKHVPVIEHNPVEAIKNNVFGTLTLAEAAADLGVAKFVLVSTDKAVRPTNVMGATKRLSEMIVQSMNEKQEVTTLFSIVRFGNVLGSSGSVIPKFRKQLDDGGPLTITHPDMTRFFMTIPEAANLVIHASVCAEGGEVFVLDMGQPVKIMDLARQMIKLSGFSEQTKENVEGDIKIEVTGLRPGEKLFEELLIAGNTTATGHPNIMQAFEPFTPWGVLDDQLKKLEVETKKHDPRACFKLLQSLGVGFQPNDETADWVTKQVHVRNKMDDVERASDE